MTYSGILWPALLLLFACKYDPVSEDKNAIEGIDTGIFSSPASVNFGNVLVGQSANQNVNITNSTASTETLSVTITVSGTDYSITDGSGDYSLTPGQSRSVAVCFSPSEALTRPGTLSISHSSVHQTSPIIVSFSGTGGIIPLTPTLFSPTNGSTGVSVNPTLNWISSTGATSYHIQISTNSGFTSLFYNQDVSNTTQQVSGLENGATYYWRINASNTYGTSPYSGTWSFTTIELPVAVMNLPSNDSTGVSTSPTFIWSSLNGATSYHLQVSTSSSFMSLVYDQEVSGTLQQISGFANTTTYYWRINASNTSGTGAYSNAWSFTTIGPMPGEQWILRSGTTTTLLSVASSGSLFVSVGPGGFLTSPDGINWTGRSSGTVYDQNLRHITWSGSQFLAEANNFNGSIILTSSDGIVWSAHSVGTNLWLYSIIRADSLLVAVGYNGAIATSSDGIIWTTRPSVTTSTLNSVAWSGSQFAAVGGNGAIITSPNGTAWSLHALERTPTGSYYYLNSVAWSGSQFVAVGDGGVIFTSTDGAAWTQRLSGTSRSLKSLAWSGSLLAAVGSSGTILTSPDGITWNMCHSGTTIDLNAITWSGSKFVVVASNGTIITSP